MRDRPLFDAPRCGLPAQWDIGASMARPPPVSTAHFGKLTASALVSAIVASTIPAGAKGKKEPEPPPDTRPKVAFAVSLSESGPDKPWLLKVQNSSSAPAKLVDDQRLLWLEVTHPGKGKPKVCRLPPSEETKEAGEKRVKELAPGESVTHPIDPRFYCFSPGKQEVLVPAAHVEPHYGFPSRTKKKWKHGKRAEETLADTPPFVGSPKDTEGPLAPVKNITGDSVVLDPGYAVWSTEPELPKDKPALEISRGSDADTERSVTVTVRLKNPTQNRLRIFFRRELLSFKVVGLKGTSECPADTDTKNPDRGAFRGVGPGGSIGVASRLVELCPRGTFAESGLYLVSAAYHAGADGADFGFEAFTGTIETERPVAVRVRKTIRLEPVVRKPTGGPGPGTPQQPLPAPQGAAPPAPAPPPPPPVAPAPPPQP